MRIGIEINGVLRNTIEKITQIYQKNYIDNNLDYYAGQTYKIDLSGNTEEELSSEPFKYEMSLPVTSLNLMEHFKFQNNEEYYSFLYEEHPMEIFGHAPSSEYTTFNDLQEIYLKYRNENELIIVSDEIGKSKPSSLFFLSKFGCEVEKIKFYSNFTIDSMWDEIDVLITSNPNLLLEHPEKKIIIKYNTSYNEEIKSDYSINKLKELDSILKQIIKC